MLCTRALRRSYSDVATHHVRLAAAKQVHHVQYIRSLCMLCSWSGNTERALHSGCSGKRGVQSRCPSQGVAGADSPPGAPFCLMGHRHQHVCAARVCTSKARRVLLHLLLNIVVALSMKQKLASSLCDGTWLAQAASAAKVLEVISMARDTLHSR